MESPAFGADGGTLYSAGADVPLQRYDIDPGRVVPAVCARAARRTCLPDVPYRRTC